MSERQFCIIGYSVGEKLVQLGEMCSGVVACVEGIA